MLWITGLDYVTFSTGGLWVSLHSETRGGFLSWDFDTLLPHRWYHLLITVDVDLGEISVFLDGQKLWEDQDSPWDQHPLATLFLGRLSSERMYAGSIRDMVIWSSIPDQQTITEIAHGRPVETVAFNDLVGLWPLDDGSGNEIRDLSASQNHGTCQGVSLPEAWAYTSSSLLMSPTSPLAVSPGECLQTYYYLNLRNLPAGDYLTEIQLNHNGGVDNPLLFPVTIHLDSLAFSSPENLLINFTAGMLHLSWQEVPAATEYHLYRSEEPWGEWEYLDNTNSCNYSMPFPVDEGSGFFQVRAVNDHRPMTSLEAPATESER